MITSAPIFFLINYNSWVTASDQLITPQLTLFPRVTILNSSNLLVWFKFFILSPPVYLAYSQSHLLVCCTPYLNHLESHYNGLLVALMYPVLLLVAFLLGSPYPLLGVKPLFIARQSISFSVNVSIRFPLLL